MCEQYLESNSHCVQAPHHICPKVCHAAVAPDARDFYTAFADYLPALAEPWADDVEVWMPGLGQGCSDAKWPKPGECMTDESTCGTYGCSKKRPNMTGNPTYATWVSKRLRQPILSVFYSSGCAGPGCSNTSGRGCKGFQTCCINGISTDDYHTCGLDRGHLVSNQSLGQYNTPVSSFNMCNIGPQTVNLNQKDWLGLELLLHCVGEQAQFVTLSGPLFDDAFDAEMVQHAVMCQSKAVPGSIGWNQCKDKRGLPIPLPQAWWKVVVFAENGPATGDAEVYVWIFRTAQSGCPVRGSDWGSCQQPGKGIDQIPCTGGQGPIQSTCQAYAPNGLDTIETAMHMSFPNWMKSAVQPSCTPLNALAAQSTSSMCAGRHGPNSYYCSDGVHGIESFDKIKKSCSRDIGTPARACSGKLEVEREAWKLAAEEQHRRQWRQPSTPCGK